MPLVSNHDTKVSDWVSYRMTAASAQGQVPRKDAFAEDKEVPGAVSRHPVGLQGSGWRPRRPPGTGGGHALHRQHHEAELPATNMTPQLPALNQGPGASWRKTRQWAITYKSVQVITGPIFTHSDGAIGNGVTVPHAYYRVVMDLAGKRAIAFILPQENVSASRLADYVVTVDGVEEQTGLDFFTRLPDEQEEAMESRLSAMWGGWRVQQG